MRWRVCLCKGLECVGILYTFHSISCKHKLLKKKVNYWFFKIEHKTYNLRCWSLKHRTVETTVSPLHMNLKVVNFKRCKCGFACPITWVIMVHESGLHFHVCASQHLYFKLELQEGQFIEPLAVQHEELTNEDLMHLKSQWKDEER